LIKAYRRPFVEGIQNLLDLPIDPIEKWKDANKKAKGNMQTLWRIRIQLKQMNYKG